MSTISTSPLNTPTSTRGIKSSKAIPRNDPLTKEVNFELPTSKTSYYLYLKGYLTKELLPYTNTTNTKPREVVIKCTICNKQLYISVWDDNSSSNEQKHFKNNHPDLSRNQDMENQLARGEINPTTTTTTTTREFSIEKYKDLVLYFIVENNIALRVPNSKSFYNLTYYLDR